jgi:isoleucyl-tRNA synthetase
MEIAQRLSSMVLALRRKVNIKVRQPLSRMMIPLLDASTKDNIEAIKQLVMNEVNVKNIEYIEDTTGIMTKRIKPNFKTLGPRYGKQMKQISALVAAFSQNDIAQLERSEKWSAEIDGVLVEATIEDFEIQTEDIPGWLVASEGKLTVALDITITEELKREGIARELVNRIQNIRKESGFEVTDKITVEIERHEMLEGAIADYGTYIAQQTLAHNVALVDAVQNPVAIEIDETQINIEVRKSDM